MKTTEKIILDACCGGRMFWFDKKHPSVLYVDCRREEKGLIPIRPNFSVQPDEIVDFRKMPYKDHTFKLIVFDPPHLFRLGKTSVMAKKYGVLNKETWKEDIKTGFNECMRVLSLYGTLVFKWNQRDVSVREVLDLISEKPLFGHPTGKSGGTMWMCFMKLPK